jgi:hypothetical protein
MEAHYTNSMVQLLTAEGPDPAYAEALSLYGRLVGVWDIDNRYRDNDGQWHSATGHWCFGWVLGGRAVQDVLWCPELPQRYPGTTIRCYDVRTKLWHITWLSPYSGSYVTQTARSDGNGGMIQEGADPDGTRTRWVFRDVTATSFHWQGFSAAEKGEFELVQEMNATRSH